MRWLIVKQRPYVGSSVVLRTLLRASDVESVEEEGGGCVVYFYSRAVEGKPIRRAEMHVADRLEGIRAQLRVVECGVSAVDDPSGAGVEGQHEH